MDQYFAPDELLINDSGRNSLRDSPPITDQNGNSATTDYQYLRRQHVHRLIPYCGVEEKKVRIKNRLASMNLFLFSHLFHFDLFYFIPFHFILFHVISPFTLFYPIFYFILLYSILFYFILFYSVLFYFILFYFIDSFNFIFIIFFSHEEGNDK